MPEPDPKPTPHTPTRQELRTHLDLLAVATTEDFDELLGDLLRRTYGTPAAQIG